MAINVLRESATGPVSRRRAIQLFGAAAGLALAPALAGRAGAVPLRRWSGHALGAPAEITLAFPDADGAARIFAASADEIERLENSFSLYRADSELSRLNRTGLLEAPSHDMVRLLAEARRLGARTRGAFDVSVQPLWELYANHFARTPEAAEGPGPEAVRAALASVDHRAIEVGAERIRLTRPGMALTLNGIAQGYITDRVADVMRREGIADVLIDIGETLGLGRHPEGRAWHIGLADPEAPDRVRETVDLTDRALATSGGYGTRFSRDGRHHHLFDPRTGRSANRYRSVSVLAPRATLADGLSTGFYALAPDALAGVVAAESGVEAIVTLADGTVRRYGA